MERTHDERVCGRAIRNVGRGLCQVEMAGWGSQSSCRSLDSAVVGTAGVP